MKKIIILIFIISCCFYIFTQEKNVTNLNDVVFEGTNIESSSYSANINEANNNYCIVYSPVLPSGAIYSIKDRKTGKEAVVQIGNAQVDKSPYVLYLPGYLFNFFSKFHSEKTEKISLKIKFLAWNKGDEQSSYLNLLSLVVNEYNSFNEVSKNGLDKHYIQLGAFSFFQNSYPIIEDMMPFLKIVPKFYIFKKEVTIKNEPKVIYRILAGPYSSQEEAKEIANNINLNKKINVVIYSAESIIYEFGNVK